MSKAYPCIYCTDDHKCTRWPDEAMNFCVLGPCKYEKPSNGDRVRAMSDEELAEFFATLPCCPPGEDLEEMCFPNDSCEGTDLKVKCWLNWLRQEADNG